MKHTTTLNTISQADQTVKLDLAMKNHRVSKLSKGGNFIFCTECESGCFGNRSCEFCPSLAERKKMGCATGILIGGLEHKRRLRVVSMNNNKVLKREENE